jgi:hypothetical protein
MLKLFALAVLAILTMTVAAEAVCEPTQLDNTIWYVYINFPGGWSRCFVRIGADGDVLSTADTRCNAYEAGAGSNTESITGGALSVSSGCVVTGFIQTSATGRHNITHAALDRGRTVLIGVGKDPASGEAWQFNGVRK